MQTIVSVLSLLGELEWYVVRPAELLSDSSNADYPPMITFRDCAGNQQPEEMIKVGLNGFRGSYSWQLVGKQEKNLSLVPSAVISPQGIASLELATRLSESDPVGVRQMIQEFEKLTEHLMHIFSQQS